MARVLMPVPDRDCDVTEVAVPWRVLTRAGHTVTFTTEHGDVVPTADPRLVDGVIFGQLGAAPEPLAFYADLVKSPQWCTPVPWGTLDVTAYDGLILPGGHAPGMRQYLGSAALREQVAAFWALGRPVGAICHGVLVLARTHGEDGHSLLHGRRTTCLPAYLERSAYFATAWKLGRYYRTYPAYVETEVRGALARRDDFERGPFVVSARGTDTDDSAAFVVRDGRYLSARWPGDAYAFAKAFLTLLPPD
jgi:putative intracellular protease/amidase